jgi:hypothetical protein
MLDAHCSAIMVSLPRGKKGKITAAVHPALCVFLPYTASSSHGEIAMVVSTNAAFPAVRSISP